jgi:hypothetical protein
MILSWASGKLGNVPEYIFCLAAFSVSNKVYSAPLGHIADGMYLRFTMGGYSTQPQVKMGSKVGRNTCFDCIHGYYSALRKLIISGDQ